MNREKARFQHGLATGEVRAYAHALFILSGILQDVELTDKQRDRLSELNDAQKNASVRKRSFDKRFGTIDL